MSRDFSNYLSENQEPGPRGGERLVAMVVCWVRGLTFFDMLAIAFIAVMLGIALVRWSNFPVFRDIYYHMGVTKAFESSGGVVLFDFWEFAPVGRAHLYPPFLHILMLFGLKIGISIQTLGRLVSFSMFFLILLSLWYSMRSLVNSRAAFYSVICLSVTFVFFWSTAVTSAASLVLLLTPLIFVALERNRNVTAAILLALCLYSHLVMGHLTALALLIYLVHRRARWKNIFKVLVGAYVLWLPWGIHSLLNFSAVEFGNSMAGSQGITVHILVWLIALAGFVIAYVRKGNHYLFTSYLLAMVPIIFFYPGRFWQGHCFLPLAMLGGVALSEAHGALLSLGRKIRASGTAWRCLVGGAMTMVVALLLFVDPVFAIGGDKDGRPRKVPDGGDALVLPGTPGRGFGDRDDAFSPDQGNEDSGMDRFQPMYPPVPDAGTSLLQVLYSREWREGGQRGWEAMPQGNDPGGQPGREGLPEGLAPPNLRNRDDPMGDGLRAERTTLVSLVFGDSRPDGLNSIEQEPLMNEDTDELARLIEANSEPDEIVHAQDPSLSNLITALTGRATTGGMFREVKSEEQEPSAEGASLVVIPSEMNAWTQIALRSSDYPQGLECIGSAGIYDLYRNPEAGERAQTESTVLPWPAALALLLACLGLIALDCYCPITIRKKRRRR